MDDLTKRVVELERWRVQSEMQLRDVHVQLERLHRDLRDQSKEMRRANEKLLDAVVVNRVAASMMDGKTKGAAWIIGFILAAGALMTNLFAVIRDWFSW